MFPQIIFIVNDKQIIIYEGKNTQGCVANEKKKLREEFLQVNSYYLKDCSQNRGIYFDPENDESEYITLKEIMDLQLCDTKNDIKIWLDLYNVFKNSKDSLH